MSQRLLNTTKWMWCFFVLYSGSMWRPVNTGALKAPPKNPTTIEAQAKFFQDFFSVQLSPYKIEFGHVCEDPNTWEQRYEKKDFKNHRDMGKVRWGDKKGGYGEHYWDLNHAGHNNDHNGYDDGSDDGSYHEESNDPYDEPSQHSPSYGTEEYNPEESSYEENGRAKRAHRRQAVKTRKTEKVYDEGYGKKTTTQKPAEELDESDSNDEKESDSNDERESEIEKENVNKKPRRPNVETKSENLKEKSDVVLVIDHKDKEDNKEQKDTVTKQTEQKHFVPYEDGAGVRQHYQPQVASASVPRLFLEPSTGHVVDRATGQAYVLQPVAIRSPIYNY